MEMWRWRCGDGDVEMEMWRWRCGDGDVEMEMWRWRCGDGGANSTTDRTTNKLIPPDN
jgi:hypothetical protein